MIPPFSNVVSSLQETAAFTEECIKPKGEIRQYIKKLGLPLLLAITILYPILVRWKKKKKWLTNILNLDFALPKEATRSQMKISFELSKINTD